MSENRTTEEFERRFEVDKNDLYKVLMNDGGVLSVHGTQDFYYQNYIYHDRENEIEERIRKITTIGEFNPSNPIHKKTMKLGKGGSRGEIKSVLNINEFNRIKNYVEGTLGYKPLLKLHRDFNLNINSSESYILELSEFIEPEYQTSIIEIEFPTEAIMNEFEPFDWFGKEITEEYSNVDIWERYNDIEGRF